MKKLFFTIALLAALPAIAGHRFYYNPIYGTQEFKNSDSNTFVSLPKYDDAQAKNLAEKNPGVKSALKQDVNYFLLSLAPSYTDDSGKTWTDWELGVGRPVMNQTLRIDYVFGVNPMTGKIRKIESPIIHQPFSPESIR
jgi:hypothetical protein